MATEQGSGELARTLTWRQGTLIVLGIPILILPSIYDVSGMVWGFSIFLWTASVAQAFLQNIAFGELASTFPDAIGIPGAVGRALAPSAADRRGARGFIASFGAWGYWFAWTPAPAVFSIMMADYLASGFDMFAGMSHGFLSLAIGAAAIGGFLILNLRGLSGGAGAGLILGLASIVPIAVILGAAYFTGDFDAGNISSGWLPGSWSWSSMDIVVLLGCFGLAQWSSCAWEGCVIYGPEYRKPSSDIPKALFACGIICLILYFFMSLSVFGTLGVGGVEDAGYSTLVPIASMVFGDAAAPIAVLFLVIAMLLIVQTGFLGGSRSMYALAKAGQLPKALAKLDENGAPARAMLVAFAINMCLISVGNPIPIIAASGLAYCIGIAVALSAYFVTKTDSRFRDMERGWRAPRGWRWVALAMIVYQLFGLLPCLAYWNLEVYGASSTLLGVVILLIYVPIWVGMRRREIMTRGTPLDEQPQRDP
jgi:amino acid transporter